MRLFLLTWLYILASFGFAFVVGYAKISLPLRSWLARTCHAQGTDLVLVPFSDERRWLVDLLQCPACLGFWIGAGFVVVDARFFGATAALGLDHLPAVALVLIYGLATAASNFILGALTGLIEVH